MQLKYAPSPSPSTSKLDQNTEKKKGFLSHFFASASHLSSLISQAMKGNKGKSDPFRLPVALVFCCLSFLAGFFASVLLSQDLSGGGGPPRWRLMEAAEAESQAVQHGDSGESRPSSIPFQILSWKPRVVYFPEFATAEQCQGIIKMSMPSLQPSMLALREGETTENTKGLRTSTGTFIHSSEDATGILDQIEQKIARATMIPRDQGEEFNILRYDIGQRYASHYDAFNPAEYGPQYSQRVATFLVYLSDVEEGGETIFPYENGSNMDIGYDYQKCIGLKVKPRQGDAVLFYSVFTNGTIDRRSLHGSCPVIKGEKWVATKWIRDQIQYYERDELYNASII